MACASAAIPACSSNCDLVRLADSAARSESRIRDSADARLTSWLEARLTALGRTEWAQEEFSRLRALALERCERAGIRLRVPRPGLCTDNGAMVAALGASIVSAGLEPSPLDIPADSSLPITEVIVR